MKSIFSKKGLLALESLAQTKTLYAFDFDGTLSKIVRVPQKAKISKITSALLERLSAVAPVAVISGRSLEDLSRRICFSPPFLIGNHGMEGLGDHYYALSEAQKICLAWKIQLQQTQVECWADVEDKKYSLALHGSKFSNRNMTKVQIQRALSFLTPMPRILPGRSVINLLPKDAPHKGDAILEIIRRTGAKHALYIGDDDTDEDVFDLSKDKITGIRMEKSITSSAQYFIQKQSKINQLLQLLIRGTL